MLQNGGDELDTPVGDHSPGVSVFLHLFPGALLTTLFALAAPLGERIGVPSVATFLAVGILMLLPFELGVLLWEARRRNASCCLHGVVVFREPLPVWQYAATIVPLLVWAGVTFMLVNPPAEAAIIERFFGWVPEPFFVGSFAEHVERYSRAILVVSAVVLVIVNGVIGPVIEELYFRGYLLPRMSWAGGWAPLLNSVLFAVYHFFTPWQTPARIIALTPVYYAVWWRRNIYIGIAVHGLLNLAASVGLLLFVLRSG